VAMYDGATLNWLLGEHLGSTTVTANSSGTRTGEIRYKAYGASRYTYGTTPTTYHFTGQREESTIGLYHYGARWYDPALGRFVQADVIIPDLANPQDLNRYSYGLNNPVKYTDPTGHAPAARALVLTDGGLLQFQGYVVLMIAAMEAGLSVSAIHDVSYQDCADWIGEHLEAYASEQPAYRLLEGTSAVVGVMAARRWGVLADHVSTWVGKSVAGGSVHPGGRDPRGLPHILKEILNFLTKIKKEIGGAGIGLAEYLERQGWAKNDVKSLMGMFSENSWEIWTKVTTGEIPYELGVELYRKLLELGVELPPDVIQWLEGG